MKFVPDGTMEWDLGKRIVVYRSANGGVLARMRGRGGVCWPKVVSKGFGSGVLEGFVCALMEDVDREVVYVESERKFKVVENVIKDSRIEVPGICEWIETVWKTLGCDTYYAMTENQTCFRYQLQVLRSGFVKHKPQFINLEFADCSQAEHAVFEWINTGRLKYAKGGMVHEAVRRHVMGRSMGEASPEFFALMAGVAGMERFPARL